jgi:hypothetical protein
MTVVLTLGPLLFTDFEVPEKINFGGDQVLVEKRLVGGNRVVHAMGRDDDDIKWSGRFRGSAAEVRARLADFSRIQGQPLNLAWSSFSYLVAIKSFKADFEQQFEIPYSIVCTVIQDLTSPIIDAALSADSAISSDVNQVAQIGAQLNIPGINTAIAGVSSATGSVESFEGAGASAVTGAQSAISLAVGLVNGQSNTLNAVVAAPGSVAGVTAGGNPATLASGLTTQSNAFSQLGQLSQMGALLQRASTNIANAAVGSTLSV